MSTARIGTAELTTRTFRLPDDTVLLDHLGVDGFAWLAGDAGFVTAGTAVRVAPDDAVSTLAHIEAALLDTPGDAPRARAVGALAFDGHGDLRIPARIVERTATGAVWCTEVAGDDVVEEANHTVTPTPTRVDVHAVTAQPEFEASVRTALDMIGSGRLEKLVLARAVDLHADQPFDRIPVLHTLLRAQPGCRVYADRGFVGATPELLVHRRGALAVSRPMAGTVAREGDADAAVARLLASHKDAHEHALVVDAVTEALRSFGVVNASAPAATTLADVAHLCTEVRCELAEPADGTAVDLMRRLHPTPAVGGTPRDEALVAIEHLEAVPRGKYAGPCGWIDANGDGEFVVALRCAQLDGSRARLHAGVGIVAGSDPAAEFAETQAKLAPMLHALTRV